jgi:hypothetical protein
MGDSECNCENIEKELAELNSLLRQVNSITVIRNIELLVKDYIREKEERAIS